MLMPDCPCYDCRVRRGDTVDIQVSSETLAYEDRLGKVGRECGNEATGGQGFAPAGNEDEWDRGPRGASVAETLHRMEVARQAEVKWRAAERKEAEAVAAEVDFSRPRLASPRGVNPKDAAGSKKAPLGCVPASLTVVAAPVFALGARKYGRFNWRETPIQERCYVEAMERHLMAYKDGQEIDPESGVSHLAHIIATASIVLDALACGTLIRDTFAKGVAAELIAAQTKT